MIRNTIKAFSFIGFAYLWSINASAHVSESCLKMIEQAAEDLKLCVVKKERENCRYKRQVISDQVDSCREQQFSDDEIVHAIRTGEAYVPGKASYYLEPSAEDSASAAAEVAKGNRENFLTQFSFVKSFPVEDLYQGVNLGGCRRAFLARGERYSFLGQLDFKRYDEDDLEEETPYTIYFFNKMVDGTCYKAPSAGQKMANGDRAVVNLPSEFFGYLERAHEIKDTEAVIVRCASKSACNQIKYQKLKLQVDYQATYLRLKRLDYCEQTSSGNRFRRALKTKPKKEELPTYCMEEDLEKNIPNLKESLEQQAEQLFSSE